MCFVSLICRRGSFFRIDGIKTSPDFFSRPISLVRRTNECPVRPRCKTRPWTCSGENWHSVLVVAAPRTTLTPIVACTSASCIMYRVRDVYDYSQMFSFFCSINPSPWANELAIDMYAMYSDSKHSITCQAESWLNKISYIEHNHLERGHPRGATQQGRHAKPCTSAAATAC